MTDSNAELTPSRAPDTSVDNILDPSFTDKVPEFYDRIAIVSASLSNYLVSEGVDRQTAENFAARAVQGMLSATAITLEPEVLGTIFTNARQLTQRRNSPPQ